LSAKSPKEAKALGLKTYFTGIPCRRGGIAERNLNADCLCIACIDFTKSMKAKWASNNKEVNKKWKENNKDKMAQYKKNWAVKNKEDAKENLRQWKLRNKEKVLAETEKRRAIKNKALPSWYGELDAFVMHESLLLAKARKKATGFNWHMDHMIPLMAKTASGLHCAYNIQVIPEWMNCSKGNKMLYTQPYEWIRYA